MINTIEFKNFKLFKELKVKTKPINIIVGKNNTGKTSFLEGIAIYYNDIDTDKISQYLRYGKKEAVISINGEEIKLFKDDDLLLEKIIYWKKKLKKEFDEKKIFNLLKQDYLFIKRKEKEFFIFDTSKLIFHFITSFTQSEESKLKTTKMVEHIRSSFNKEFNVQNFKKRKILLKHCETINININVYLKENPKLIDFLEEIVKEYGLIDDFEGITENYFKIKGNYYPFKSFGDGLKQFLTISILVKDLPIILLDEPTAFMHPGYTKEFISFLIDYANKENKQVFISTHDIDLIESLLYFEKYSDEIQFIRLLKNDKGDIIPEIYNFEEAKKELEIFKMDLRGL